MKQILFLLKKVARLLSTGVVYVALTVIYGVVVLYRPFIKTKNIRWFKNDTQYKNQLKQTELPW